jgi:hypothetical protein
LLIDHRLFEYLSVYDFYLVLKESGLAGVWHRKFGSGFCGYQVRIALDAYLLVLYKRLVGIISGLCNKEFENQSINISTCDENIQLRDGQMPTTRCNLSLKSINAYSQECEKSR